MKDYLIARAKEPSTWRGVVLLLTAIGVALTPDQQEAVVAFGLGVAGLVGAFTADKKHGGE